MCYGCPSIGPPEVKPDYVLQLFFSFTQSSRRPSSSLLRLHFRSAAQTEVPLTSRDPSMFWSLEVSEDVSISPDSSSPPPQRQRGVTESARFPYRKKPYHQVHPMLPADTAHHDSISTLHAACVNVNQSLRPILFASGCILAFPHTMIAHRLRIREFGRNNLAASVMYGVTYAKVPMPMIVL